MSKDNPLVLHIGDGIDVPTLLNALDKHGIEYEIEEGKDTRLVVTAETMVLHARDIPEIIMPIEVDDSRGPNGNRKKGRRKRKW